MHSGSHAWFLPGSWRRLQARHPLALPMWPLKDNVFYHRHCWCLTPAPNCSLWPLALAPTLRGSPHRCAVPHAVPSCFRDRDGPGEGRCRAGHGACKGPGCTRHADGAFPKPPPPPLRLLPLGLDFPLVCMNAQVIARSETMSHRSLFVTPGPFIAHRIEKHALSQEGAMLLQRSNKTGLSLHLHSPLIATEGTPSFTSGTALHNAPDKESPCARACTPRTPTPKPKPCSPHPSAPRMRLLWLLYPFLTDSSSERGAGGQPPGPSSPSLSLSRISLMLTKYLALFMSLPLTLLALFLTYSSGPLSHSLLLWPSSPCACCGRHQRC